MSGKNTSTTVNSVPAWLDAAGQDVYKKALDFYSGSYTPPPTDRVAGFSPMQTTAFDRINSGEIGNVPRIVDETGKLGAISDYINPNLEAVLNPAIRKIQEASAAERGRIGDSAFGAHAYGDARHGILEGQNEKNTKLAIGDTTAQVTGDAWNNAMALRGADADRMRTGTMDELNALLGAGTLQQQNAQSTKDAGFQDWQLKQQDQYDRLAALLSGVSGVPATRTQTTTEKTSGSPLGLLGSVLGAVIK